MHIDTSIKCGYLFIYSARLLYKGNAVSSKIEICFTVAWISDAVSVFLLACSLAVLVTRRAGTSCLPFSLMPVWLGPAFRPLILLEVSAARQCSLTAFMAPFVPVSDFVGMQGFCYTFCGAPAYYLMLSLQFHSWRIWMYSQTQVIQSVHVLTANGPGLITCRKWQYSSAWLTPFSLYGRRLLES